MLETNSLALHNFTFSAPLMEVPLPSLAAFPEEERTAYLRIVAALAAADGQLAQEELLFLQAFCEDAELTRRQTGQVLGLARGADGYDLDADLRTLRPSQLAAGLLRDLRSLAEADDEVTAAEEALIEQVSVALGREQPDSTSPTPLRNFVGDALVANSARIIEVRQRMEAPHVTAAELDELGKQLTALTRNQQRITGAAMDRAHAQAQRRLDGAFSGSRTVRPGLTTSAILSTLLGADDAQSGAARVAEAIQAPPAPVAPPPTESISVLWRLLARFGRSSAPSPSAT
jgi:uncharacterized tellurite resistance protein B-like protein